MKRKILKNGLKRMEMLHIQKTINHITPNGYITMKGKV